MMKINRKEKNLLNGKIIQKLPLYTYSLFFHSSPLKATNNNQFTRNSTITFVQKLHC